MKIILFILLFTFSAHADRFVSLADMNSCQTSGADLYSDRDNCEKSEGSVCVSFPGESCQDYDVVDNMVVDFIRKEKEESCLDLDDCQLKLEALVCEAGYPVKNLESMSVYCAVEFLKKDGMKLVVSPAKKAAREAAEKAAQDAKLAEAAEKELAVKEIVEGADVKGTTIAALRAEINALRALLRKVMKAK